MADRNIPTEWLFLKFTEILDVQGGTQPPKSQFIGEPRKGYIRLLQIRDFGKKPVPTFIPDTSKLKKCNKDDILIGRYGASLGRICTGMEGAYNVALAKVITPPSLDRGFLHGYLDSEHFQGELRLLSRSAQNGFNKGDLETFDFLLPPLAEQKVIDAKLDTLMANVETTKARLERIPQILKRFRQSGLAAAVSGRLTEEWRGRAGLPEWEVTFLGEVIGNIDQGWSPKCHNEPTSNESWGVIKTSSVLPMAFLEHENKKLPNSLEIRPHLRVLASDILTTRAGPRSRCGITCYVNSTSKNLMICDKVYRYRVIEGKGCSKFLALQLNSPNVLEKIETLKTGISESGMNLTQKKFRQLKLNWPTPEEQTEIIRRVDQLFAHADRIEQQVNNALTRVNNLTQSILAKAFRGELTEQWRKDNPDLISGENSAEALLEKIKAERSQVKPAKRKSKKTMIA
ncbi:MAG: restriction endonuclease subunit S [Methylophaga sp.]|nr:restriction endonuclease subunit S [Methylophaga sp.]